MINFFKKIRKNLVNRGKTSKYFKYAIGEIILVVIGILIALQINNWNEERKNKILEYTYLENIKTDLSLNITELQQFITSRKKCIISSSIILDYFEQKKALNPNDFNRHAIDVMIWYPFQQHNNTYQELLNSGKLSLISNKTIKDYLQNMETSFKKVAFVENEMQQDFERYLYDPFFNKVDLNTTFKNYNAQISKLSEIEALNSEQIQTLLEDQLFKNGFVLAGFNSDILITEYTSILKTTKHLINLINTDLDK